MTVEQLQAENEKLNGRLQKAIAVFGEQKANIERVTKERDTAREQLAEAQARITEFESKVAESSDNDTKFFEQLEEINNLNVKNAELEGNIATIGKRVNELEASVTKAAEAYTKLEEDKDALLNQLDAEKENHKNDNAEFGRKIDELNARLTKAAESYKEQQETITRLKDAYDKSQEMLVQNQEARDSENAKNANEIKALNDEIDAKNAQLNCMQHNRDTAVERVETIKQQVAQIQQLSSNLVMDTNFNIFA